MDGPIGPCRASVLDYGNTAPETGCASQKRQGRPKCDALLSTLADMANMGKVQRCIRETVAVLVEELGPEGAAEKLEHAAAQLRRASHRPRQGPAVEARPVSGRPRVAANR